MKRVELPLTVRYAETDQMGVVHHAAYVVWLEAGRVRFLEEIGLPYAEVERRGWFFPVVELALSYRAPARFGERVVVACWLEEVTPRTVRFGYEVLREGRVLVRGHSRHVVTDRAGRVVRMPAELFGLLRGVMGEVQTVEK